MPTWPAKLLIMSWRFHRPSYFYTFSGYYSRMFLTLKKTNQLCEEFTGRKTRLPGGNTCEACKKLKTEFIRGPDKCDTSHHFNRTWSK